MEDPDDVHDEQKILTVGRGFFFRYFLSPGGVQDSGQHD